MKSYDHHYKDLTFYYISINASVHTSEADLWFYQDSVDKLREAFNKLELIMDGEPAIYMADPAFKAIVDSLLGC